MFKDIESSEFSKRLELVTTVLLAATALLAAWNGFQAARWTVRQGTALRLMLASRLQAAQYTTQGAQQQIIDVMLFSDWLQASAAKQQELELFYRQRFRPEFKPAFEEWLALNPMQNSSAPPSPFALAAYQVANLKQAAEFEKQADEQTALIQKASANVTAYVTNTLYMATALFFLGISRTFAMTRVRLALVVLAAVLFAFGLYNILTTETVL